MAEITYKSYQITAKTILILVLVGENVWVSEIDAGLAGRVRENVGGDSTTEVGISARDIVAVEFCKEVPRGSVLPQGELSPTRRFVHKTAASLGKTSGRLTLISGCACIGTGLGGFLFPPLWAFTPGCFSAAMTGASVRIVSAVVEGTAETVGRGYVRFKVRCKENLPESKEDCARAEFLGTMKRSHFNQLCEQVRGFSDTVPTGFQEANV